MYDLAVDGVASFYQRRPGAKQLVRREPLVGLVDGSNTVFLVGHRPFLEDTLVLYSTTAPLTPITPYGVDADGGVVILPGAPAVGTQVTYDLTAVPLLVRQVIYFAIAGFQLMEWMWSRDLLLSNDPTTYAQASADDAHLYIVSKAADGTLSDPVCGTKTFSTSFLQQAFLAHCIEFAYLDSSLVESAMADLDIRERAGGIAVNAARRPANIRAAKEALEPQLLKSWYAAMDEYYPSGEHYIQSVDVLHTTEYEQVFHWQTNTSGLVIPNWVNRMQ